MNLYKYFFYAIILFIVNDLKSQELNAQVIVNSDLVNQTNQKIFKTLQNTLNEFINTQAWGNAEFLNQEKITCSFIFTFSNYKNDKFDGTLQVQSQRTIFQSNYDSPIFNFLDKDISFSYQEFQPLFYNRSSFESNLVSIISYYAFLILGMDADSFLINGGSIYLTNAQSIVSLAQQTKNKGWQASEGSRNRFWLIESMLSNTYHYFRESLYIYHRKGLDNMINDPEYGKESVSSAIINLENIYSIRPDSFLLQIFFDSKSQEIVDLFSGGPIIKTDNTKKVLKRIAPFFNSKWKQIKD
jgi:hypothetical protein